jgi:hypothetical protein
MPAPRIGRSDKQLIKRVDRSSYARRPQNSVEAAAKMRAAKIQKRADRDLCLPLIRPIGSCRPPQVFVMKTTRALQVESARSTIAITTREAVTLTSPSSHAGHGVGAVCWRSSMLVHLTV